MLGCAAPTRRESSLLAGLGLDQRALAQELLATTLNPASGHP